MPTDQPMSKDEWHAFEQRLGGYLRIIADVERLQRMEASFPHTRDGKSIRPGMTVWFADGSNAVVCDVRIGYGWNDEECSITTSDDGKTDPDPTQPCRCYSSAEAAQKGTP